MKIRQKNNNLVLNSSYLVIFLVFTLSTHIALANEINPQTVTSLVNQSRSENNLGPLVTNATLSRIAQDKAQDMLRNNYFSHTSPIGLDPWHWFEKNNYTYKYAGENLAINYTSAEEEHQAWMESPTHKKNILSPNFSEIGIATATGNINGKKSLITVQEFGFPQNKVLTQFNSNTNNYPKYSYILATQPNPSKINLIKEKNTYKSPYNNSKKIIFTVFSKQINNIIWTIALILILIISRDLVLKTIYSQTPQHKNSLVNLILFIMLCSVFFQ